MNTPCRLSLLKRHRFRAASLVLACLLLSGWSFAANASAAPATPPTATGKPSRPSIEIGMIAEQVRAIIGNPHRIKPLKHQEVAGEIWLYTYSKPAGVRQVPIGSRDTPVADPLSGTIKMQRDPVYGVEQTYLVETTELLMVDGTLVSAKRYRSTTQDYH